MGTFSQPSWGEVFGNYLGALLYGAATIAIGVFISSLTVSQIIAAIGTFIVSVFLMYLDMLAAAIPNEIISSAITWLSFTSRYNTFTQGLFSVSSVVFFLSVAAVFIFSHRPQGGEPPLGAKGGRKQWKRNRTRQSR